MKRFLPLLLATLPSWSLAAETPANNPILAERHETPEQHDARMQWFRDARFGMFIHWGLYAQAGGEWNGKPVRAVNGCQEWIMHTHKIPRNDYAKLASQFNPTHYNAEAWVLAAKNAGMRYIVITSKHHEGFAMFQSKASPYNIVEATPFKKDPLKELADACRKHQMKLGFYYSQNLDWYHPGGGSGEWDPSHRGNPEDYVNQIAIPQIKEILSNYGDIAILWFDIPGGVINKDRANRIMQTILACNPNIIINNRLGGGYHGDIETPEQHIPATGFPGRDWESCMTLNGSWGYAKNDHNWKSSSTLIANLVDIASKGGNYLLNVGPNELGEIPQPSLDRLKDLGAWLQTNGKAIYGTKASIFPQTPSWGRFTTQTLPDGSSIINAIVLTPPANATLTLPGLTNDVISATCLSNPTPILHSKNAGGITVSIPKELAASKEFVIAIHLKGKPTIDHSVHPNDHGEWVLSPRQATFDAPIKHQIPASAGLQTNGQENLGNWTNPKSTISWQITCPKPTTCQVKALVSSIAPAGSTIQLTAPHTAPVTLTIPSTGSWDTYKTIDGSSTLSLPAGTTTLTLSISKLQGQAPCNLASLTLTPTTP